MTSRLKFSHVSPLLLLVTALCLTLLQPVALDRQALLSMGFPRQEYLSGLLFPAPGDLPDTGIEPTSPALAGRLFTTEPPGKPSSVRWLLVT